MSDAHDNELAYLREEIARQREENSSLRTQLTAATAAVQDLAEQLKLALQGNAALTEQLKTVSNKLDVVLQQYKKSKRKDFGSNNEKLNPRPAAPKTVKPVKPPAKPKVRNHKKHILEQDLTVSHKHHYVDAERKICPTCLIETKPFGNHVTHQLERIAQTLQKLEHIQEVRSCRKCRQYVVTAHKPAGPIPGSYVGPRLLAYTCVAKLAYGLPLYRQSKIFKREKINIPRSTQCDWMLAAGLLTEQLWELMKREIKKSKVIKTDDTHIKIQDPTRSGTLRAGKMTPYSGDKYHPYVVFDFSPDLSFERNLAFFEGYFNMIQADAARGFDALFKGKNNPRLEVGCNAHSRRKYFDYYTLTDPNDEECFAILEIYRQLYRIEDEIAGKPAAVRLAVRRRRSKPLIKKLRKLLFGLQEKHSPSNGLMQAVNYTLTHWIALTRFVGDSDLDIDNNESERVIKDFVLCRKNFLFAGSNNGGRAIAILLSLIATCHRLKIDPIEYLADLFDNINNIKASELEAFLPDRWAARQQQKKAS